MRTVSKPEHKAEGGKPFSVVHVFLSLCDYFSRERVLYSIPQHVDPFDARQVRADGQTEHLVCELVRNGKRSFGQA